MKKTPFCLLVTVTLFACQTRGRYCVNENEMLYVKRRPNPTEGNYVFADRFGQQRIPNPDTSRLNGGKDEFAEANEFSCGLALVRDLEGKWRYLDRKEITIIDTGYTKGEIVSRYTAYVSVKEREVYCHLNLISTSLSF